MWDLNGVVGGGGGDIHYYHAYNNNNKYLIIFVIFIQKLHTVRVSWSFTTGGFIICCLMVYMTILFR